jgi:hypothetical protein
MIDKSSGHSVRARSRSNQRPKMTFRIHLQQDASAKVSLRAFDRGVQSECSTCHPGEYSPYDRSPAISCKISSGMSSRLKAVDEFNILQCRLEQSVKKAWSPKAMFEVRSGSGYENSQRT